MPPIVSKPTLPEKVVIASRESLLAMWQAKHVQARLQQLYPGLVVEILGMTTQGDRILDVTLNKIGGKGLFVKELEIAMEAGQADFAVHSSKDVPMQLPAGFTLAAIGEREDPRDAFVSNRYADLTALPAGAVVGTSSLRRECQIRSRFPQLVVKPLRGNVQTRLRKLDEGQYDAIILAAAGLRRLALTERITSLLPTEASLPAVGQGALAIECRADREDLLALLAPLNHPETAACVRAERAMSRVLGGSCQVPLGGFAEVVAGQLQLRAFIAMPDGSNMLQITLHGPVDEPEMLGQRAADALLQQGAANIMAALDDAHPG
ncbi:hydroxymethylbilane synthase [Chitinivorax tropicus]|uniref:hydroxymethylbilane synthase n=1 Tax=Chitinivorax tropicus TaxID=714531 RepID=UPI001615270C